MKKIISLVLCIVLVLSFGMVSFADESIIDALYTQSLESTGIAINSVTVADAYNVTVEYASDAVNADSQVAILVFLGETPTEDNIVYIDQFQHSTGSYTFPLYSTAADGTYKVVMGATGVDVAGTATFTIATQPTTPDMYGDVSGDSKVTAIDASQIAQNIVGSRTFTALQTLAADVDVNGTVTSLDASLVRSFIVGKLAELPYVGTVEVASYDD